VRTGLATITFGFVVERLPIPAPLAGGKTQPGLKAPRRRDTPTAYSDLRRDLGKAILVGLELLVAADIISSVAINPTFATVGVLGLIVLIRTFLSWSLEVEVNGRWPWQSSRSPNEDSRNG